MHIAVFPGWYPSRIDKLSGDFIQRHMDAISMNAEVSVIIPIKDKDCRKEETETVRRGAVTETYYYYPSTTSLTWLDNLLSFARYNYLCIKATRGLVKTGKVDLVHIYVIQKNHLVGLLLKLIYKIPYVVSEQSTLYIDGRFEKMSGLQQKLFSQVFQRALSYHSVSNYLQQTLQKKLALQNKGVIIPNVVDTTLFYYNYSNKEPTDNTPTFVHVSNLVYQKNVQGMLQAFAGVRKLNPNFILNLVGPVSAELLELIEQLELAKQVVVWNERSYREVAEILQQSDVFVFFTRFETFGCVIIEANACGLPAIVSDLEVTHELVTDHFNGLFVHSENIDDLTSKIIYMLDNLNRFDPIAISMQTRGKFNYQKIGQQFYDWYTSVVSTVATH